MRDRSLKIDSNPAQKAILRYQMVAKMDETEQTQSRLVASFSVMTQGLPMKLLTNNESSDSPVMFKY